VEIEAAKNPLRKYRFCHLLIPGQSVWDLWWTKWYWNRFYSEYFAFPLSVSFRQHSVLTYSSITAAM
jgi:hypothetical protein